ncbi:MAG: DUF5615 family PIN-like protein [Cyanobacteria bacterium J06554_11]
MKLLFDENLSPKLPDLLADIFPNSKHVRSSGLLGATDEKIWEYARKEGFTIVSKDSDFQQRSVLRGYPPKVVWLRIGNCTRQQLITLIRTHEQDIRDLAADSDESVLVLS